MAKTPEPGEAKLYEVIDEPFYDGVVLHPVGSRVSWAGKPGRCLQLVDAPNKRKSTTEAPVFPDPLAGRGDKAKVAPGAPVPAVFVQ